MMRENAARVSALKAEVAAVQPVSDADLDVFYLVFAAAARRAQSEPFDVEHGRAARQAWIAFMAAGGLIPVQQPDTLPRPISGGRSGC